jgi:hypothetical protein
MKELILNAIGRLGGRKFLVAMLGLVAVVGESAFGISTDQILWIGGIVIAYILGQSVADGLSQGATSTVARVNSLDDKAPLLLFCLLPLVLGGCSSVQAQRTAQSLQDCAIAYDKSRDMIDEAFLGAYRNAAQAQAEELAAAAVAAETDAGGKASAKNIQIILAKKGEHYQIIEAQCMAMRAKIGAAKLDLTNLLAYNEGLKAYFKQQADFQAALNNASAMAIQLIEQITKGRKPTAAELVPLP